MIDRRASRTESLTRMVVVLEMRISRICSTSPTVSSLFVFMYVQHHRYSPQNINNPTSDIRC